MGVRLVRTNFAEDEIIRLSLRPYLLFVFLLEVIFHTSSFWHSYFVKFSPSVYVIKFSLGFSSFYTAFCFPFISLFIFPCPFLVLYVSFFIFLMT